MNNRIADYRKMRGMSLDDLSEASGLSKSTLSELERGITKPMLDSARRIASALDAYESELWPEDSTMPLTVRTTDTALAAAEARIAELEKALELIAESCDVGRHDGLPEEGPALCATESWLIAKDALVAYRKGSEE